MKDIRSIGFISGIKPKNGLYGIDVAEMQLLKAILEYSSWDKIIVWSENPSNLGLKNDSKVIVKPLSCAKKDIKDLNLNIDCLHHVGIGASNLNYLRTTPIPIFTSVFPALSYNSQIQDHFFELFAPKLATDINIYPSSCSLNAVQKIRANFGIDDLPKFNETVIPIGIDQSLFNRIDRIEKNKFRKKYNLKEDIISFFVLTRFSPSDKADILPLLRSLKFNQNIDNSAIHIYLCGGDTYFGAEDYIEYLREEIADLDISKYISIIVSNDRNATIEMLKSADVFISPSDSVQETFGITPLEAMSCGLPVIVSDWNGYKETVINNETGFLITTTFFDNSKVWDNFQGYSDYTTQHLLLGQSVIVDTDLIIEKCLLLSQNSDFLLKMSNNAFVHSQNYSWKSVIQSYEKVWNESLTEKSKNIENLCKTSNFHNYWKSFNHYASVQPKGKGIYKITDYGKAILFGQHTLRIYDEISSIIDLSIIGKILTLLNNASQSLSTLDTILDCEGSNLKFIMTIMCKHNLIKYIGQ
ncbi:MAG: glycosyltransferase family 4 protein [Flavobacterium sp.]|nr:glycosyltransferase family 4 protein [Flavobacterium sp.]